MNSDNTMTIEIMINEGEPYKFGDITFVGNTVYSSEKLKQQLGIKENDIFDQSILDSRLFGSPEGNDISSLYLDDGYLFFNATPFEISAKDKKIDFDKMEKGRNEFSFELPNSNRILTFKLLNQNPL